jgi:hypothetical protein
MKAYCLIREQPHYRREAFVLGLKAAGYQLMPGEPRPADHAGPGDVLVIWNRYWHYETMADRFEAAGGRVIVAENGYIGRDASGIQHYALALHGHNGSGRWPTGGAARLKALNLDIRGFQDNPDGHILVCAQRGIGSRLMASPKDWHTRVAKQLAGLTRRTVRVRLHPEDKSAPRIQPPLDEDLKGAWACVVWSSSSGVKALVEGIPVFWDAPFWICAKAGPRGVALIEQPWRNEANRIAALIDMAAAQWSVAEIASGLPFVRLRDLPDAAAE